MIEFRINETLTFCGQLDGKLFAMADTKTSNQKETSDVIMGFVLAVTFLTAVAAGILSYSFNNRVLISLLVGCIVVFQGFVTWKYSAGRNK